MENKYLKRINELAAIQKKSGLTEEEKKEQAELRKKYVAEFRKDFRNQIEHLKILNDKDEEVTPEKLKEIQRRKGIRKD